MLALLLFSGCHPNRSEGSQSFPPRNCKTKTEILRYAQNDNDLRVDASVKLHRRSSIVFGLDFSSTSRWLSVKYGGHKEVEIPP